MSHQLQVPQQDLLRGADLLLGGLGRLCSGVSWFPPLVSLVLLLSRAGGQVVMEVSPRLLAAAAAAAEAVLGITVSRYAHHGLTCKVTNQQQRVKPPQVVPLYLLCKVRAKAQLGAQLGDHHY